MTGQWDNPWIWHPEWIEKPASSAGAFVHFRKFITLDVVPNGPVNIAISADTRYKLYVNSCLVHAGPVKADTQMWFYDVVDIQPYLCTGRNHIAVHVLRFYYGSQFAASFPRTAYPGLYVRTEPPGAANKRIYFNLQGGESWETAIDPCIVLPTSSNFDFFLQIFERVDRTKSNKLDWVAAKPYNFMVSHGLAAPWNLHPRMIPFPHLEPTNLTGIYNIRNTSSREGWDALLGSVWDDKPGVLLSRDTTHHVEFGVDCHTTAYVTFRFARPSTSGSRIAVTWSEGYEDEPIKLPFDRKKGDRADTTKVIAGPKDQYIFGGFCSDEPLGYGDAEKDDEIFAPFHFRTFRYIALDIKVAEDSDLVLKEISIVKTNYPIRVLASFPQAQVEVGDSTWFHQLWDVSVRTLQNYMHDCYEDCPFFEQLQYAMDTRSSALFTYFISRDDRLAKQAIIQLYNSFQPALGLTASRAPSHHLQIISHFSLFWTCMVTDHYEHFGEADFVAQFLPVIEGVLHSFHRRVDQESGLVRFSPHSGDWAFVDCATGFMTYTNQLYAYALQRLSALELCLGRQSRSAEHVQRAESIARAVRIHCYDGTYFTDGLARLAEPIHYSEHSQIWAVLCGAITGKDAVDFLNRSLAIPRGENQETRELTRSSVAMAFYSLRALSAVGDGVYEDRFHDFWEPWKKQLELNMTTWVEDYITQRSDCHAWGSLPLYEYTAEVVGLKPVISGVCLFKVFEAKVPVEGSVGRPIVARVRWDREEGGATNLSIAWEGDGNVKNGSLSSIYVYLPGGQQEEMKVLQNRSWRL
ncbi:Six-hairpin glycosidase-like protein [Aspergillus carlsbadensis]|nr:Six-hairpin glycosidase-like protein [Aspergillus carlsbadensis]